MGSAAMMAVAKRGYRVCGIEQFHTAHARGSSHGQTRIIRKAYFEHPDYMPLIDRAYEAWQALGSEINENLIHTTGMIVSGPPNSDCIRGVEACYDAHPLPHDKLKAGESRRYFPQFSFPDNFIVYHDPLAGYLQPEKCVSAITAMAVQNGAHPFVNETVLSWQNLPDHVEITTNIRTIAADKLVVAAGAWAHGLLAIPGLHLDIWRKPVFWYTSSHIHDYQTSFPIFFVEFDGGGFYGFPAIDESGLKVAEHTRAELVAHPDELDREPGPDDEAPILNFLDRMLPDFIPQRTQFSVCMYTMTADGHFILDRHPKYKNIVVGAGFSGHGFKFAPVIGEVLADLALNGATDVPVDLFGINRLIKG